MIALILGTTAELIKASPVIVSLVERGNEVEIWNTAMHVADLNSEFERLVPGVPIRALSDPERKKDIARSSQVPGWIVEVLRVVWGQRKDLRGALGDSPRPLVLVHGDTLTTILGATIGRGLHVPVGHIEAGFRTSNPFLPFPEELNRRAVSRLARIHFAPGPRHVANLKGRRGQVVDTGENTAIDALRTCIATSPAPIEPDEPYGVVTLHRFELMRRPHLLRLVLEVCREASRVRAIKFYTGPHGLQRLAEHDLDHLFDDRFRLMDKLPYAEFVRVLAGAEFVLTDSGGLQLECAYLGLPCLVHREHVETFLGVGGNVVLSGWDLGVVSDFLSDPSRWRRESLLDSAYPTRVIVDHLVEAGHAV